MQPIAFIVPGSIDTPTGGYAYDRQIVAALRRAGRDVRVVELAGQFPDATEDDIAGAVRTINALPASTALVVDGLALGVLPAAALRPAGPLFALVHHPLALETGLSQSRAAALAAGERQVLAKAAAVVVTSPHTRAVLERDYAVPPRAITVALPGLEDHWFAIERTPEAPPLIVSVGSVTPRKGHDTLVSALAACAPLEWRAVIAGSLDLSPETAGALRGAIAEAGLDHRITLAGTLSPAEIASLFGRASLFALASHYEGFGMVFAEAMAAGLPVVGTKAGAVTEVVPESAGTLVDVGDHAALGAAIARLLADPALAAQQGNAGRAAARALPTWDDSAATIAAVVDAVAADAAP